MTDTWRYMEREYAVPIFPSAKFFIREMVDESDEVSSIRGSYRWLNTHFDEETSDLDSKNTEIFQRVVNYLML